MNIEVSNATYLLLCALIKDSLEVHSDATILLRRAAWELSQAIPDPLPMEMSYLAENFKRLRRLAADETEGAAS